VLAAAGFEPVAVGAGRKFDLSVSVTSGGGGWAAWRLWERSNTRRNLFERRHGGGAGGRLVRLLAGAVRTRIGLSGLNAWGRERESSGRGWNATGREVLPGSLPCLLRRKAGRRPDATAVVFERGRLKLRLA